MSRGAALLVESRSSRGAAPFNPDDYGNTDRWFDGRDLSTLFTNVAGTDPVDADLDPVGRWNDKRSAAAFTMLTDAARPEWQADAVNGQPGIYAGGANYLDGGDVFDPGTRDMTTVLVMTSQNQGAGSGPQYYALDKRQSSTSNTGWQIRGNRTTEGSLDQTGIGLDGANMTIIGNSAGDLGITDPVPTPKVICMHWVNATPFLSVSVNAVAVPQSNMSYQGNPQGGDIDNAFSAFLFVGNSGGSPTRYQIGHTLMLIIYFEELTPDAQAALLADLMAMYGAS